MVRITRMSEEEMMFEQKIAAEPDAVVVDRARFERLLNIAQEIKERHDEVFGLTQPGVDRLYGTLEPGDLDPLP
jgi:hypothetical protein